MICAHIQELFGSYFDLPEGDPLRRRVDDHVSGCKTCEEEFGLWAESSALIRSSVPEPSERQRQREPMTISSSVMQRIYTDEKWRVPVQDRMYRIPYKLRRNLSAMIAFCIALFLFSFVYHLSGSGIGKTVQTDSPFGFHQAAKATAAGYDEPLNVHHISVKATAMAGGNPAIIAPIKIGTVHTPDYWLAFSFLGLTCTLLIMNWLSRTRS